jgi:hypothetical protein
MPGTNQNALSVAQIDADLFLAASAIRKSETISSKAGKHLRGLAGYHLQQAAEKLIKIQILKKLSTLSHQISPFITFFHRGLCDIIKLSRLELGHSPRPKKSLAPKKMVH